MPNEQLHTFPEGKVYQEDAPIRRLKWGTASLIVRAPVTPIILPIFHRGFEQVFIPLLSIYYEVPKKHLQIVILAFSFSLVLDD